MVERNESGEVRAAGCVVWRRGDSGETEILVIHRPSYDDWSLPKGKVDEGETDEECAVREVEEETGLRCRLGRALPSVRYLDRFDRPKVARYWLAEPAEGDAARPQNEIDAVEWLGLAAAKDRLTYDHDRDLIQATFDNGNTPG